MRHRLPEIEFHKAAGAGLLNYVFNAKLFMLNAKLFMLNAKLFMLNAKC